IFRRQILGSIAVIGLGEAGRLYADGLLGAAQTVRGYDPFAKFEREGFLQSETLQLAVADADIIISLVGARASLAVSKEILAVARPGALLADLNTGSPALKKQIAEIANKHGVLYADV